MPFNPTPHPQRFWDKVTKTAGCWLWTAYTDRDGYAYYSLQGVRRPAHVIAYELLIGPVPPGKEMAHGCHNPRCVRPHADHVRPRTHRENMLEGPTNAAARAAAATHCPSSHRYDAANTYINPRDGSRTCRTCHRERSRLRRVNTKAMGHQEAP